MSESQNEYYEQYFKNGGTYELGKMGASSRIKVIQRFLESNLNPGSKILDIGCGDMYFSKVMPQFEWVGVDLNTEKAMGKAFALDAMKPPYPFEAKSFSAAVSSEFLEHIWDMRVVHREAHRLLENNGVYVISTPNFDWAENFISNFRRILYDPTCPWTLEHIRHYTPADHIKYLDQCGFKAFDVSGADPHYGTFFQVARSMLKEELWGNLKIPKYEQDDEIDALIGRMFPQYSPSIVVAARKA